MKLAQKAPGVVAAVIVLLWIGAVGAQEDKSDDLTKEQLQSLYTEYLTAEGYRPEIDSDGDVSFKREGRTYFIDATAAEKDQKFFRVALPNIFPIENDAMRSKVLAAADYANAKLKVCKVYTVKDNVWLSVELFVDSPDDFKPVFARAMSTFDLTVLTFLEKVRE